MEFYLRSQDEQMLVPFTSPIYIVGREVCIRGSYEITLGKYKSNWEAKRVLDDVQRILSGKFITNLPKEHLDNLYDLTDVSLIITNGDAIKCECINGSYVYTMPKYGWLENEKHNINN